MNAPGIHVHAQCILSSIVIVSLKGMFEQFKELKTLYKVSWIDTVGWAALSLFKDKLQFIWLVSFTGTVCWDVRGGLIVSVVFALFTILFHLQKYVWYAHCRIGSIHAERNLLNLSRSQTPPTIATSCGTRM